MEDTESEQKFAQFWDLQLRKLDKGHARKAWRKALKIKSPDDIINAYKRFVLWAKLNKKEQQFIPYPATWLNGERWDDQLEGISMVTRLSDAEIWRYRLKGFKSTGGWSPNWGPKPGHGCDAPKAILQEFGLSP